MSLLDDVSLMITPNGASKNVLFGVLPQPIIGAEKVTDGDFPTGTSAWTTATGWAIANGSATCSSGNDNLSQNVSAVAGKTYKITLDVTLTSGRLDIDIGNCTKQSTESSGTKTFYMIAVNTDDLRFYGGAFRGSISNVSVREYTSADMDFTRATSANRVNPSGLVDGVTENLPRLDYRVSESCPHILVESQRTNICLRSQQINESVWVKSNATVNANSEVSPNGIQNAEKVQKDGVSANDRIEQTITISNSTSYTISAFLKNNNNPSGGKTTLAFRVNGGTLFRKGYEWTGSTLAATTTYASGTRTNEFIEDYGNGWYRVGFSFTSDGTSGEFEIDVDRSGGTSTTSIYLWGCQLEEGSYKTAYILTTSASATRNGEVFDRTGIADLINSSEGVFFIEMAALADDGTHRQISLSDGTADNRVTIGLSNSTGNVSAQIKSGGAFSMNKAKTATQTNFNKIAVKWKVNDMAVWLNGSEVDTDVSGAAPIGLNQLSFQRGDDANYFYGKIRQIQVYKTALSDTQLGALTT